MHDNEPQHGWDNSLEYSEGFRYPDDEPEMERTFDVTSQQVIIRMATLLFASQKPKLTLAAMLYASGIDVGIYLSCENIEVEIAKALGETKQGFSWTVKQIKKDFDLKSNTGISPSKKDQFKNSNYRPRRD